MYTVFCFIIFVLDTDIWISTLNALKGGSFYCNVLLRHIFNWIALNALLWVEKVHLHIGYSSAGPLCSALDDIFKVYFYCNPFFALHIG